MTATAPNGAHARWLGALLAAAALVMGADLASKAWAHDHLRRGGVRSVVGQLVQLEYRENRGLVFGWLSGGPGSPARPWMLTLGVVTVIVLGALLVHTVRLRHQQGRLAAVAVALALAGAAGNVVDRAQRGFVVDFIVLAYRDARWPTFNVADVALSAAMGLGVLALIRRRVRERSGVAN